MSRAGRRAVDAGEEGGLRQVQQGRADAKCLGDCQLDLLPQVPAETTQVSATQERILPGPIGPAPCDTETEQDPLVLAPNPHVLSLPFVCGNTLAKE